MPPESMQLAFENHFGIEWGNPENQEMERIWAAGWHARRSTAIQRIEQDVLPKMGRQSRGVKMCIDLLNT